MGAKLHKCELILLGIDGRIGALTELRPGIPIHPDPILQLTEILQANGTLLPTDTTHEVIAIDYEAVVQVHVGLAAGTAWDLFGFHLGMAQGTYKTGLLAYGYGLSMKPKGIGHFCIVYRLAGNRLLLNCTDGGLCAHRLVDYRQEG